MRTAELKGSAVAPLFANDCVILAADTIVVLDDQVMTKPADKDDAFNMLVQLRNRTHQVYTGIFINNQVSGRTLLDNARVEVPMRYYTDVEIREYVDSGDPLDKAGAYAIQHPGFAPAPELSGCFAAVVGLPLCHVARALIKTGITIPRDVPQGCQLHNSYECHVFPRILGP